MDLYRNDLSPLLLSQVRIFREIHDNLYKSERRLSPASVLFPPPSSRRDSHRVGGASRGRLSLSPCAPTTLSSLHGDNPAFVSNPLSQHFLPLAPLPSSSVALHCDNSAYSGKLGSFLCMEIIARWEMIAKRAQHNIKFPVVILG